MNLDMLKIRELVLRSFNMFTRKITLPAILAILAFSFCTTEIMAEDNEKKEKKETTTKPTSPPKPAYVEDIGLLSDRDVGYGAETSFLTWHGYINFLNREGNRRLQRRS